jgi:hypothetical protein
MRINRIIILASWLGTAIALYSVESLLNIETLQNAKQVEVRIFNKETGKPTCKVKYQSLQKSQPKLGPLTINLDVLRLENLRLEIDLQESTSKELFPELNRYAKSRPFHFIDASPAIIQGSRQGEVQFQIQAGRAKFHGQGGFSLLDGVTWKIHGKEGQTPQARLVFDTATSSWMLLSPKQELLSKFLF